MPLDDAAKARSWITVQALLDIDSRSDRAKLSQIMKELGDLTPRDAMCIDAGYTMAAAHHRAIIIGAAEATRSVLSMHRHGDIGCLHCIGQAVIGSLDDILMKSQSLKDLVIKVGKEGDTLHDR